MALQLSQYCGITILFPVCARPLASGNCSPIKALLNWCKSVRFYLHVGSDGALGIKNART